MRKPQWVGIWLALICSAAAVLGDERSQYLEGKGPLYHTTAQIHARLSRFSKGLWMKNITLRDTTSSNTNQLYRVYNGRQVTTSAADALPTALLICNQHAREVITGEICFWLLRMLAQDPATLLSWPEMQAQLKKMPALSKLNPNGRAVTRAQMNKWTTALLTKMKVEVVPVMNRDGRDYIARSFDYTQRKTVTTDVDLNRNWVTNRASPSSGADELNKNGEEYQGPYALSEWQTRQVYSYMKSIPRKAFFVDVHSGTWALMAPYGGVFDYSSIPMSTLDKWQSLMNTMQYSFRDASNSIGVAASFGSALLYASQGSADDTAYVDAGFPFTLTVETYAPLSALDNGIGWTCPGLRYQQLVCTQSNMCGSAGVCKDRSGTPQIPSVGKHAAAEAANAAAGAAEAAKDAAAAAAAGTAQLDVKSDPYLKGLAANSWASMYFYAFCPSTAQSYRDTVSKWVVSFLGALDYVSNNL